MMLELLYAAFRSLAQRKLRTFLTALGLVIGVASVVTMISAGQAAKSEVQRQIQGLGTNLLIVTPGSSAGGGVRGSAGGKQTLLLSDADAIRVECPSIEFLSPTVKKGVPIAYGNKNWSSSLQGCSPEFLLIRAWPLAAGGFFNRNHVTSAAKVCVLGKVVADKLFDGEEPLGKTVRVKHQLYRVIGLLEEKGNSSGGQDQDDVVLAPYTTVQRLQGITHLQGLLMSARTEAVIADGKAEVEAVLSRRHKIRPGMAADFTVRSQTEIGDAAGQAANVMTILLGGIASVSLIVGGIGIMNIMLVTVSERTREIGIRMAVGARGRDILIQFLAEAVTVCLIGGLPGAALGWLGAAAISRSFGWQLNVSPASMALALSFSIATGLFFGIYPAWRASRLDPVEALRYE